MEVPMPVPVPMGRLELAVWTGEPWEARVVGV